MLDALSSLGLKVDNELVANVLVLIIAVYFLFVWGVKLYEGSFGDFAFLAWFGAFIGVLYGYSLLTVENDPRGYLGFIPVLTYIVLNILHHVTPIRHRANSLKALVVSSLASALVYVITKEVFGIGIAEASISAILTAAILAWAGYRA